MFPNNHNAKRRWLIRKSTWWIDFNPFLYYPQRCKSLGAVGSVVIKNPKWPSGEICVIVARWLEFFITLWRDSQWITRGPSESGAILGIEFLHFSILRQARTAESAPRPTHTTASSQVANTKCYSKCSIYMFSSVASANNTLSWPALWKCGS